MFSDEVVKYRGKMIQKFTECGHFGVRIVKNGALLVNLPLDQIPLYPITKKIPDLSSQVKSMGVNKHRILNLHTLIIRNNVTCFFLPKSPKSPYI